MTGAVYCELKIDAAIVARRSFCYLLFTGRRSGVDAVHLTGPTLEKITLSCPSEFLIGPIVCLPEICESPDEALQI